MNFVILSALKIFLKLFWFFKFIIFVAFLKGAPKFVQVFILKNPLLLLFMFLSSFL